MRNSFFLLFSVIGVRNSTPRESVYRVLNTTCSPGICTIGSLQLRYTILQVLTPSYRFRHCRLVHHFLYRATRFCSIRPNVLRDDFSDRLHSVIISETLCIFRPKSGSMLLYSRKKVRYRRDGYCWKKRKDGKTTREDHMKLKVQGMEVGWIQTVSLFD